MMSVRRAVGPLLALALFAGCRMNTQHEVFLSELRDIATGAQAAGEIGSTFRTPFPTTERCQEYRPRVLAIFGRYHDGVSAGECVLAGQFTDLTFTAKSAVMRFGVGRIPGNNVFALAVRPGDTPATMHLFAAIDRNRLNQLQTEIRALDFDTSRQTITIEQTTVILNNDTGGSVHLRAPSAFVNREPVLVVGSDMPRRTRLDLRLSDVAVAELSRSGQVLVAVLGGSSP